MEGLNELRENMTNEPMSMDFANSSSGNITNSDALWKDGVKPILDYLLLVTLLVLMLAMGCEVTWMSIWYHIRRPIGLLIGIVSQFGLKPLCSYAVLKLSGVQGLHATGVIIIACGPGGVLSNAFTYFIDGDLGLSIAMTTASTIIAMGLMPANLWLYGRSFESDELVIPYKEMAISLVTVTSPVILGMIVKWKFPFIAKWFVKMGSFLGVLMMFACIAFEIVIFPDMFDDVPLGVYGLVVILPVIGCGVGYFLAFVARQNTQVQKTVAIECGIQNVPVALTIIALSFPIEMQKDIVLLPWLYGFVMIACCSVLCIIYQFFKRRNERLNKNNKQGKVSHENCDIDENVDLMDQNGMKIVMKPMKNGDSLKNHKGKELNKSCFKSVKNSTEVVI